MKDRTYRQLRPKHRPLGNPGLRSSPATAQPATAQPATAQPADAEQPATAQHVALRNAVPTVKSVAEALYDQSDEYTREQSRQIARAVRDGYENDKSVEAVAREIGHRLGVGPEQARVLAVTETTRVHAADVLTEAGKEGDDQTVTFVASSNACPRCSALHGGEYTIAEAQEVIPVHPNCTCRWAPIQRTRNVASPPPVLTGALTMTTTGLPTMNRRPPRAMRTLTANLATKGRTVNHNGRDYYVTHVTMMVPGVLPGSSGPIYYPADELARNPGVWNGTPITLNHPTAMGRNVSARHPAAVVIGRVVESRFTAGKLNAEAWFDVEATRNAAPNLLHDILAGKKVEVSTGLYLRNEPAGPNANHKGRAYQSVARNMKPDHLAVLTDQLGACSVFDGCGVNNGCKCGSRTVTANQDVAPAPTDPDVDQAAEQPADEQPADEQPADEQPADEQPADQGSSEQSWEEALAEFTDEELTALAEALAAEQERRGYAPEEPAPAANAYWDAPAATKDEQPAVAGDAVGSLTPNPWHRDLDGLPGVDPDGTYVPPTATGCSRNANRRGVTNAGRQPPGMPCYFGAQGGPAYSPPRGDAHGCDYLLEFAPTVPSR